MLRSLFIRPPQELVAQLRTVDPKLWSNRPQIRKLFNVYVKDTQHTREMAQRDTGRFSQLERVRGRQLGQGARQDPERTHDQGPDKEWQPTFPLRELGIPDFHGR